MSRDLSVSRSDFPPGFVFGAATSAFQIEGSAFGGAGLSHWDTFAATPGNVVGGENARGACEHYLRWEDDLDLVRDARLDAYRFSINWARLIPDGSGAENPEGFDFYDRLIDGMLARGLKPCLTLYHWDLPAALARRGGWANRDIAGWFADYATRVVRRYGDRVDSIATINEPWCVAWLSHFLGLHAPGLRDIGVAAHAMHHVLLAHGDAIAAMRAEGNNRLGIVLNFEHIAPATDAAGDIRAAVVEDALYNRWFIEAIAQGHYPVEALAGLAPYLPAGWESDMDRIARPIDWLGVNYYRRALKRDLPGALWPAVTEDPGPLPKTTMGWEIYPEGLEARLVWLSETKVGALPIVITENGMSADDHVHGESVDDAVRVSYIDTHMRAVRSAIARGANVKGFFYWSLLDNFEWALGYDKRFGLVHVDYATQKRTPKASYHAIARMLGKNG